MKPMLTEPKSYYISHLRRRKVLLPVPELLAYRCVTTKADGPQDGDEVILDQVAFDDILIGLGVYPKRNLVQTGYARVWRKWHMDKVMPLADPGEDGKETLLYRLDSPHNTS